MTLFRDIESTRWLFVKGALFLLLAVVAGGLLWLQAPQLTVVVLLMICVWASCRAYYFAFYVIQHYVDSSFRFSGLFDFFRYVISRRSSSEQVRQGSEGTHE